jgi:cytochrome P450
MAYDEADPYPRYRELRETDPIHYRPSLRSWAISRHADVLAGLRDERLISLGTRIYLDLLPEEARPAAEPLVSAMERWMLFSNPPNHERLRGVCARAFTPRVVESLRGRIGAIVDGLLDEAEGGPFDLMKVLAEPLPTIVIAELLGAPSADRPLFRRWSDDLAAFFGMGPEYSTRWRRSVESWLELTDYLKRLADDRRKRPREDLTSAMVSVADSAGTIDEEELIANVTLLLFAGHETTINLIGNGSLALLRTSSAWADLRDYPEIIVTAIEELLRYDSPVQSVPRKAKDDFVWHDKRIEAGHIVVLLIGSAHRDPLAFADPDSLDLRRKDNRHLAFGQGIHFCLGAPLARLEGQIALASTVRRFPRLVLAETPLTWRIYGNLRGLKELMVDPAGSG